MQPLLIVITGFLNQLRRCPSCHCSFGSTPWLCRDCLLKISLRVRLRHRLIRQNLDHFYLFEWEKGDDLTPVVHSLKGGGLVTAFEWLASFFPPQGQGEGPIFYPTRGRRDHAEVLGEVLGRRWGRSCEGLLRQGSKKQSLLSKNQRKTIQFQDVKKAPKRVDWVDDIVTTGATSQACHLALGQSAKMTVWSLFYRKSL